MLLRLAIAGTAVLLYMLCYGCDSARRVQLPADPGILQDSLGIGIQLGLAATAVHEAAGASTSGPAIEVLTREELNQRSPYSDRDPERDLVLALYEADPGDGSQSSACFGYGMVDEIRCYLARPEKSLIKLLDSISTLSGPMQAEEKLGEPFERRQSNDGQMHLDYYFALPQDDSRLNKPQNWALKLVLSFAPSGECYAVAIAITEAPTRR